MDPESGRIFAAQYSKRIPKYALSPSPPNRTEASIIGPLYRSNATTSNLPSRAFSAPHEGRPRQPEDIHDASHSAKRSKRTVHQKIFWLSCFLLIHLVVLRPRAGANKCSAF